MGATVTLVLAALSLVAASSSAPGRCPGGTTSVFSDRRHCVDALVKSLVKSR